MHVEVHSEKSRWTWKLFQSVSVVPYIIFVVQLIGFFPSKNKVSCQHRKTSIAFLILQSICRCKCCFFLKISRFKLNFLWQMSLPSFYIGRDRMLFGSIQIYDYFDICFDRVVCAKSCVYSIHNTLDTYIIPK